MKPRDFLCRAAILVCSVALVHCTTDQSVGTRADSDAATDVPADGADEATLDADPDGAADLGGDQTVDDRATDVVRPTAEYGEQCTSNANCVSGFCIASSLGFVCTQTCEGTCPPLGDDRMTCRKVVNFGADEVFVCTPVRESICEPCLEDRNCFEGACVPLADGNICGADCAEGDGCPEGTFCFQSVPGLGDLDSPQCLPNNLTCDCSEDNADATRPCARSNDEGTRACVGHETCDPARGWMGCDAPLPQTEVCDGDDDDCNGVADDGIPQVGQACEVSTPGIESTCTGITFCEGEDGLVCIGPQPEEEVCDLRDNNCDGQIDEGFTDELDRYVGETHCGVCGNDCSERFPEGYEFACQVVDEEPMCVVTACPPGYTHAGLTACIPLASSLCLPCSNDAACNEAVGDQCVAYTEDQGYCGRDCSASSPFGTSCPTNYSCDEDLEQCVLDTGTCICDPGDLFTLSCEVVDDGDPTHVCPGRQLCDDGTLYPCQPDGEVCNGIDDNCDGNIDEGFLGDSDEFSLDEHCDRCYNDCTDRFSALDLNADFGFCDEVEVGSGSYECRPHCEGDWQNADGLSFNGCECHWTSDMDDPDPSGIDANCDGIDGHVDRGVFVSPTGDDDGGDGSIDSPYATLQKGISMAVVAVTDHVYVEAGVYDTNDDEDPVVLRDGISVFGGYGVGFANRNLAGNETAIIGLEGAAATVSAADIVTRTTFDGFTVVGLSRDGPGESSYAIHIVDCGDELRITNTVVRAGNGGTANPGSGGATGTSAAAGAGGFTAAGDGGAPWEADDLCDGSDETPGGAGAQFECPDYAGAPISTSGGDGGTADCPQQTVPEPAGGDGAITLGAFDGDLPTDGGDGGDGGYSTYHGYFWGHDWVAYYSDSSCDSNSCNSNYNCRSGDGCYRLSCCLDNPSECDGYIPSVPDDRTVCDCTSCYVPGPPQEGMPGGNGARGRPGSSGLGCASTVGTVTSGHLWLPDVGGGTGGRGGAGSGGGGGGAGGGLAEADNPRCVATTETLGGGGGGGGAGGCGGEGGTGGDTGGGSFGIFIVYDAMVPSVLTDLPVLLDNTIVRGFGGPGGVGGPAGEGGLGSAGGIALEDVIGCSGIGGIGGAGGPGGAGGGGGGGCGGISAGIYVWGPPDLPLSNYKTFNEFPNAGLGGTSGQGGASAAAPGQEGGIALHEPVLPCGSDPYPSCGEVE